MQRSKPFARSLAMMAAISAILSTVSDSGMRQLKLTALGPYESRGKGQGTVSYGIKRSASSRRVGKHYPFSSARQNRAKYYTATVNGFPVMQRMSRKAQDAARRQLALAA